MTPEEIQEMLIRIDERTISIDRRTAALEEMFQYIGEGEGFGRCVKHHEQLNSLDQRMESLEKSHKNFFRTLALAVLGFIVWLVQELIASFRV